jgi:hypothetical protein
MHTSMEILILGVRGKGKGGSVGRHYTPEYIHPLAILERFKQRTADTG